MIDLGLSSLAGGALRTAGAAGDCGGGFGTLSKNADSMKHVTENHQQQDEQQYEKQ